MRWAQLTLVEDDPGKYDPAFWLDYFRRTHSDAACLSAGGCIAYYPTKVPFHYRSKFLGNMDAFSELVAGCRKLGMNVIGRTDLHAAPQDVYDAHPDWIAVDAQGKKRKHWADVGINQEWLPARKHSYYYETPNATGTYFRSSFGDWKCEMVGGTLSKDKVPAHVRRSMNRH